MPLPVQDRAVIFGGGHCTQALVPVLSRIDFRITVIDNRPELSLPKLFPEAETVLCGDYFHISDYLDLTPSDYVVVMTNGHTHDLTYCARSCKIRLPMWASSAPAAKRPL